MLLFQAGALSSETDILFPSETDLPKLTRLPSQNKPTNKHTGRECKLDRVFLPQVESKPPRAILFWRQFGSQRVARGDGEDEEGRRERYTTKQLRFSKEKQLPLSFFSPSSFQQLHQKRERREIILMNTGFFYPLVYTVQPITIVANKISRAWSIVVIAFLGVV